MNMKVFFILAEDSNAVSVTLTLKIGPQNKEYEKTVMQNFMKSAPQFLKELCVYPSEIREGSVIIHLDPVSREWIIKLKNSVLNGAFIKILQDLFNSADINKCLLPGNFYIEVSIAVDKTIKSTEGMSSKYEEIKVLNNKLKKKCITII